MGNGTWMRERRRPRLSCWATELGERLERLIARLEAMLAERGAGADRELVRTAAEHAAMPVPQTESKHVRPPRAILEHEPE
jgi:hypothetical protein